MMKQWIFWLLAASAALAQAAAPTPAPDGASAPAAHAPQAAPATGGHAKSFLGSGVAFGPDGRLWLVGLDAHGALFVQHTQGPGSARWMPARVLDTQGAMPIAADGESRPKIAFGKDGVVVISYTQPTPRPYSGNIRMLRSVDGGQTFSAPFIVHADRQEITHRFDAIAFDGRGALHTLWVDKRDLERAPKVNGKSTYRGAAIYRNVSLDGGATFGPDIRVADHSCECCRIALAPGMDGTVRAMWRHVFEPNIRDHALVALDTEGKTNPTPVRATLDDWRIDACPHHGAALSASAQGGFHTVWFGVRKQGNEDDPAVRYGRLGADGSPDVASVRALPDDMAEHADVLSQGHRVAVVWRSSQGALTRLRAWLSRDSGQTFQLRELGEIKGGNDFPRLAQYGERMVVVWRTAQEAQIHELAF